MDKNIDKYKRMESKLWPCPFCGSKVKVYPQVYEPHGLKGFSVHCFECSIKMDVFSRFQKSVISNWNRRCLSNISGYVIIRQI